ncbi:MAG: hypothetical protein R6V47_04285 [Candidatus Delongbacteria bacterium]
MRIKYFVLIFVLVNTALFSANIVITGFDDDDPKTGFITGAMVKYISKNLKNAGAEIKDEKTAALEMNILRHGNFFLASRDYFEDYDNIDLDYSIHGTLDYRGSHILLFIQLYSREKRRLVLKTEIRGKTGSLLAFFHHVTREIFNACGIEDKVENVFPVQEEGMLYKYLKFSDESDKLFISNEPERYYALLDELEAMKEDFDKYPAFEKMYDELVFLTEDYEKFGPFDLPLENVSEIKNSSDNEIQSFARELIAEGYLFFFRDETQKTVEEKSDTVDLTVDFEIKMKKSAYTKLMKEIKKRKGNTRFINMGRYFFSENDKESSVFRDMLLNQTVEFRFVDELGDVIVSSEYYLNKRHYSNGMYRNADDLPFPLTPRGPAYPAFGLKSSANISFEFRGLKKSDIEATEKTEILIRF